MANAFDLEQSEHEAPDFLTYEGSDYLTDAWEESGLTWEDAVAKVKDPYFLGFVLDFIGLEPILKDDHAVEGLLNALVKGDPHVLLALARYAQNRKPRRRRGPKVDAATGKFRTERALEMRKLGWSFGKIATQLYGDPKHRNRASALVTQAKRRNRDK